MRAAGFGSQHRRIRRMAFGQFRERRRIRPEDDEGGRRIGDDVGDFSGGKPPADRNHDGADLHGRKQRDEIGVGILAQPDDARAFADTKACQSVGELVGQALELGKAGAPSFELEDHGIRTIAGMAGQHIHQGARTAVFKGLSHPRPPRELAEALYLMGAIL